MLFAGEKVEHGRSFFDVMRLPQHTTFQADDGVGRYEQCVVGDVRFVGFGLCAGNVEGNLLVGKSFRKSFVNAHQGKDSKVDTQTGKQLTPTWRIAGQNNVVFL